MNKETEYRLIQKFKELYSDFPKGKIIVNESPDFIIESKFLKVGIELTEIFQDSHLLGYSRFEQLSSDGNKFTLQLIEKLQKYLDFTFTIGIFFNDSNYLRKSKNQNTLNEIFKVCLDTLLILEDRERRVIKDYKKLPKEIDEIHISKFDGLESSYNECPEGGSVSDLTDLHLNHVLKKKHKKLKDYEECNEHWLLIKEGKYYSGSFGEIKIDSEFDSIFDKIFLLRSNQDELIELK